MTDRLYYTDSYLTSFTAKVVDRADGGRRLYLDRTAFYPTSGGQPHDLGFLDGVQVLDVVEEENRVAHLLAGPIGADTVEGKVDWPRRFDHMQQHTGQHLLSAVLAERLGCQTVSVHFGPEVSTLDLDVGTLSPDQIRDAEARANVAIGENQPVTVSFEEAATATGLRKASDRSGILRIVTIAGLDRSACGGTHVHATGEIGALLIRKVERVKKQARLEFLCGARAIRRARADYDILSGLAAAASSGIDEMPQVLEGQREQLKAAMAASRSLAEEMSGYRARAMVDAAPAGPDGLRRILDQTPGATVEDLRTLAHALIHHQKVVFAATIPEPATILLAASPDSGVDAARLLRETLTPLGGRGGGTARLAQGGVPSAEKLTEVLRMLGFGSH
jgi:alanyl-tRNA synthetase